MELVRALKGLTKRGGGRTRAGSVGLAVLLGAVPLALSACGGSSASGAATSTTKPSATASRTAYTACLKQHGVTLPSFAGGSRPAGGGTPPSSTPGSGSFPGGFGGGLRNNPNFQKAAAACQSLRPSGGFGGFGRGGTGGFNSTAFAAYRNCLTLHGVTQRTPGTGSSAGATAPPTFNPSSPTVQAAMQACAALRPSPTTTTTPG